MSKVTLMFDYQGVTVIKPPVEPCEHCFICETAVQGQIPSSNFAKHYFTEVFNACAPQLFKTGDQTLELECPNSKLLFRVCWFEGSEIQCA
jgi:hypothetical protein